MTRHTRLFACLSLVITILLAVPHAYAAAKPKALVTTEFAYDSFPLLDNGHVPTLMAEDSAPAVVHTVLEAFASDLKQVSGTRVPIITSPPVAGGHDTLLFVGVLGSSPLLDRLEKAGKIKTTDVRGHWESALTQVVDKPMPGVDRALVIAGADRRGAAYALFALSRQMGVSPWAWWADVPVARAGTGLYVSAGRHVQATPSVQYRGIFFNDEDWGLRPWAAAKMDPELKNIGPHTYERTFELLLRLHANSLWPAMHPGSRAFNATPENAKLADKWAIVMGSSHSEALLRNNVGEWDEKVDGPWNYQTNRPAIDKYWEQRVTENGKYENFYTVGMRGVHDSGLEATGTPEVKARLVEEVMRTQQRLLAEHVSPDVAKIPQVIWLYKESLDLYRVGMKVPPDVTLGWTDDNYGYIRQLPTLAEQQRPGGSGIYYHVSYWGSPHDYLWLCSTPPAQIREEMTKAYDHNVRRYWILNVGDLKPAEADIDYFMQLAADEPGMAAVSQQDYLKQWFAEQFPDANASAIAELMTRYYRLNFERRPEFMGFNGYDDGIKRTAYNPLAWGDQNKARNAAWQALAADARRMSGTIPADSLDAFFELVGYPIQAAAAMNEKFLKTDRTYLDVANHKDASADTKAAQTAYAQIQSLTAHYNELEAGKWAGMMSVAPRERHVFEMPQTATAADAATSLPASWAPDKTPASTAASRVLATGFVEEAGTVSINAAHVSRSHAGAGAQWQPLKDLGISGDSMVYGQPGLLANAKQPELVPAGQAWLDYDFTTTSAGAATLAIHLLPTFAVDADYHLRFAVQIDNGTPVEFDASDPQVTKTSVWQQNVLRNSAIFTTTVASLTAGKHTARLIDRDPGVIFEHLVLTFAGAPPAYPVPPETFMRTNVRSR